MLDLKLGRFWLCLVGILAVLIGIVIWLFVGRSVSPRLRSGDVLIYNQEKIWWLDPSDGTLSLLLEPAQKGILEFAADFHVSPKHDYMYLMAHETAEQDMLFRYDLKNGDLRVITYFPTGTQMSPVFPDGEHALIMMYPSDLAETGQFLKCVLDFETGDCSPIDPEIPVFPRGGLWFSGDRMLTTSIDRSIKLLSFRENQFSMERAIVRSDMNFYLADRMSDCCVVLAAYRQDEGKPVLLSLDLDTLELLELPLVPTDYGAAFSELTVSSTNQYIAYQQNDPLEVKELSSGKTVAVVHDVLYSAWFRDTDSMVMYVENYDYPDESDELVVLDVSTGKIQTILTLDQQVWFEIVP